ncbi:NAD(P)H azoreductase [Baekduia alba]|uniref:NAD(P)H-binding protein n=1 Tax=Baekduia alba TaxID=2997333 RepID=UPI002340FC94|nr:NAD(P)H-binding protein [Baekduia alba]WCB91597.1 NAD(P)H azoreductase [Baekduia alba]
MIVVTGATSNVGRPLVQALVDAQENVVAVSRRPPDRDPLPGVRYEQADLADPPTLGPAVKGADALFLLVPGELHASGELARNILEVARSSGVKRVVLLSSQGVRTRPDSISHSHLGTFEAAVAESGLDWTILRPGGFASNALMWAEMISSQRMAAAPFGDVGLPSIDPVDIAEVAAAALIGGAHVGRTYELTGPAPISPRERVQAISDALGAPVQFVELSREDAREHMLAFMPGPVVDGTLSILGEPTADEQAVSPDVERILARPPRAFAEWAKRHADVFG